MDVITTHLEAEFDSFAAMVAAKKLYPQAKLVFPGSQEKALREYLKASPRRFGVQRLRTLDLAQVTRLVLVDTRRRDRIGPFAEVAARPGVEVHVYDHHPASAQDVAAAVAVVEDVGAATTVMTEIIRQRKLALSPEEATLLALGIYEDTGSLTFAATTPRDLQAAAWLLEQGANLNVVADHLAHELTPEQVLLLNDLLRSLRRAGVRGVEVGIASASRSAYVGDLSLIAHKVRDMENLAALFLVVRMGERVHLVARSRIGAVDAGAVAARFGGGGHPTAGSAVLRETRVGAVKKRLLGALRELVAPARRAREIMTHPVMTIERGATLAEARQAQVRTGLHVLPVVAGGRFLGLLSRPVTEKAVRHGFGDAPVSDYMSTEVERVTPAAPFSAVEEIMLERGQRFLPVVERGRLVGAITRTDYLRALRAEAARAAPAGSGRRAGPLDVRRQDVGALIAERVAPEVRALLAAAGEEAEGAGVRAYVVGGWVRDLLLHEPNLDLDLMVEGDGVAFAQRLGRRLGGRVHEHRRFETAVVVLPDGRKIDVATARAEYYEAPGAMPTVEHGTVKMDLFRRDFTINALAVALNPPQFGTLLDFFGGLRDLQQGVIQVLHNLSFVEDPTRVFRAIRFEQRLHFRLGESTHRLIRDAVAKGLFDNVSGPRIFGELELILRERNPLPAIARMDELGVLRWIHPRVRVRRSVLRLFGALRRRLAALGEEGGRSWVLFLAALCEGLSPRAAGELCERLAVPPRPRRRLLALVGDGRRVQKLLEAAAPWRPGAVHALLAPWPRELVIYLWSRTSRRGAAEAARGFLEAGAGAATELKGRDLKALGYRPGPIYREILGALLEARLDGEAGTRAEEVAWVLARYPLPPLSDTIPRTMTVGNGKR
jgi:tRNA nucleotidyltransferase (CCA-adding enzyme)